MRTAVATLLAALCAAGCSSTSTAPGGSSGTSATSGGSGSSGSSSSSGSGGSSGASYVRAHDRCVQMATAACQHDQDCGRLAASDSALCIANFGCDNYAQESLNDAQVDAGRAGVDATLLADCLADINAAPCCETGSEAQRLSGNCDDVSRGTTALGGSCETGNDCPSRASCVRDSTACGGTCQGWLVSGACGLGYPPVAPGFICARDGGVVSQGSANDPCRVDSDCAAPLVCVGAGDARVCGSLGSATAGSACSGSNTCALGLTCIGARVDAGGICFPQGSAGASCAAIRPDGGAFDYPDGGARPDGSLCLEGEYCDPVTLQCQPQSPLTGPCATDGGNPRCVEGGCQVQSDLSGLCAFFADGASCTRSGECASSSCVPVDGGGVCGASCP